MRLMANKMFAADVLSDKKNLVRSTVGGPSLGNCCYLTTGRGHTAEDRVQNARAE